VSSPFLSAFDPASLSQIECLNLEQVLFVLNFGTCFVTPPANHFETKVLKHQHNCKEEADIAVVLNEGVPMAELPFKVERVAASYHDFVCLLKDGTLI
jgi:hypothetical protein